MKVTDTHSAAAEHFDYLDRETAAQRAAVEQPLLPADRDTGLDDLIEATSLLPAASDQVRSQPKSA